MLPNPRVHGGRDQQEPAADQQEDRGLLQVVRYCKMINFWPKNQDGEISVEEFKDTLGASFVKEEDWEIALKDVDTNKNGKIDFSEFMLFFKNLKTQES